jgi:SAM-dependent methyltransferase
MAELLFAPAASNGYRNCVGLAKGGRKLMKNLFKITTDLKRIFWKTNTLRQPWVAYEPDLIPQLDLMRQEGIDVLEEWFRWAEEWSMLLRVYGGITKNSALLEIGCGLGRTAFPLRYILSSDGSYDGFEICHDKIKFLQTTFHKAYPNFRFIWANIHNTFYNPKGQISAGDYRFPYPENSFDIVYAASVFTHMLPETTAHYFQQAARVLKPHGRCLFSFFLLDNYQPLQPRPLGFARPDFNFDHQYNNYGDDFAIVKPENPEYMTAYSLNLIKHYATQAGLELAQAPIPGLWSGSTSTWVGAQDLVVLKVSPSDYDHK